MSLPSIHVSYWQLFLTVLTSDLGRSSSLSSTKIHRVSSQPDTHKSTPSPMISPEQSPKKAKLYYFQEGPLVGGTQVGVRWRKTYRNSSNMNVRPENKSRLTSEKKSTLSNTSLTNSDNPFTVFLSEFYISDVPKSQKESFQIVLGPNSLLDLQSLQLKERTSTWRGHKGRLRVWARRRYSDTNTINLPSPIPLNPSITPWLEEDGNFRCFLPRTPLLLLN